MRLLCLFLSILCSANVSAQQDSSHFLLSFDKVRIYYEDSGSGEPVILVHGFLNTGQNWKRTQVYKSLKDAGYRVIIPDLRGNGKSDRPHTAESYANDAEAKDIMALADHLALKSYHLIGYSRGSIIAARLLVLDQRVWKAVLGGMGTDFTNAEWPRRKLFYHLFNGDTTVPEMEPLINRLQTDTSLDRTALTMQQKEQPSTPASLLNAVEQSVFVVCGQKDSDNGNAKALAELFKNGKFAEVPGDHNSAVTTKDFADNILFFFSH